MKLLQNTVQIELLSKKSIGQTRLFPCFSGRKSIEWRGYKTFALPRSSERGSLLYMYAALVRSHTLKWSVSTFNNLLRSLSFVLLEDVIHVDLFYYKLPRHACRPAVSRIFDAYAVFKTDSHRSTCWIFRALPTTCNKLVYQILIEYTCIIKHSYLPPFPWKLRLVLKSSCLLRWKQIVQTDPN